MALARYVDLTIDAHDPDLLTQFWAQALRLRPVRHEDGYVQLVGEEPTDTVWIRPTPPCTIRRRVHLDVYASDTAPLVAAGGRVVDQDTYPWDVLIDPEGRELTVLNHPDPPRRMSHIVIDSPDPEASAAWWGRVLDARVHQVPEDPGVAFLEPVPGAPFESLVFAQEPSPKEGFNSMRFAVAAATADVLLMLGATVCEESHFVDGRTFLRDPFGTEFTWVAS